VKQATRFEGCRRKSSEPKILTPKNIFDFCKGKLLTYTFLCVTKTDIAKHTGKLEKRFAKGKTVPGTSEFHSFRPLSGDEIEIRKYSLSLTANTIKLRKKSTIEVQPNSFVAVKFAESFHVGNVTEVFDEDEQFSVQYFKMFELQGKTQLKWPSHRITNIASSSDFLCEITEPESTRRGRVHTLKQEDKAKIDQIMQGKKA
jgi:hypothetical protein